MTYKTTVISFSNFLISFLKKILISLVGLPAVFILISNKVNVNLKPASVQGTGFGLCLKTCFLPLQLSSRRQKGLGVESLIKTFLYVVILSLAFSNKCLSYYPAKCLNFAGDNDYVLLPAALSTNISNSSLTQITIEYWFQGSSLRSAVRFQNSGAYIIAGWGNTPGSQKHVISTEGGTGGGINVGANATDGNWHHIAMTWQKNTVNGFKSYLDGVLVAQKNSSNINLPAINVAGYLGAFGGGSEFMNGTLDKVRIWTRALPQSEIIANKFLELSSGTGLIASYNFNQGIGQWDNTWISSLTDASANAYNGTLHNFNLYWTTNSNFLNIGPDPRKVYFGNNTYINLSEAFYDINTFVHNNNSIVITIDSSITEPPEGATLNGGGWNDFTIKPSAGKDIIVSGNINPGSALITLNNTRNLKIDGLNSGGSSLTFTNTRVSSTSGTSTIKLLGSNYRNTITRCNINGSSVTDFNTFPCANVLLYKSNNLISDCNIGPAGSNLPSCGVYVATSSDDTIKNCNIFDFFSPNGHSSGIYVAPGNTDITINNNRIYQTSTRTFISQVLNHYGINVNNPSGNFRITGNTIGYSSSNATGLYTLVGTRGCRFFGIHVKCSNAQESVISENTITSIDHTVDGTTTILGSFIGILVMEGLTTVNNNNIGPSLVFRSALNALDGCHISGIVNYSTDNWTTIGNKIEGVSLESTMPIRFYAMRSWSSANWNCTGNTIGGTAPNSIYNSGQPGSFVHGIAVMNYVTTCNITSNTIQNITSAGYEPSVGLLAMAGNNTLENNVIRNLKNENPVTAITMSAVLINGGNGTVRNNMIKNVSTFNSSSTSYGIEITSGDYTYVNNMISLGSGNSSDSIKGISESGGNNNFYYNSIYIGGTSASGSSRTFAFNSTSTTFQRNYYNNIFYNARTNNGSTGKHYAIKFGGNSVNPPGLSSHHNDLYVNGAGGMLGLYNNTDTPDLSSWQSATGHDISSISTNPNFILDTNLHIDSNVVSPVNAAGIYLAGYSTDYDNNPRSSLTPDIGADEFTGIEASTTLDLTMFIEGSYNAGSDSQVSDTVKVYLRGSGPPYAIIDSATSVVSANGTSSLIFSNVSTGTYYIQLNHRNSIETWSSSGVLMTQGNTVLYNFSIAASQAYGNNMRQVDSSPIRFAIFSGDVNHDGVVDGSDAALIDNDAFNFATGYVLADLNGDEVVDGSDAAIADNNAFNFVGAITP